MDHPHRRLEFSAVVDFASRKRHESLYRNRIVVMNEAEIRYHASRAAAHLLHPQVFTARGCAPVPLAVGTRDDLAQSVEANPGCGIDVGKFLPVWCGRPEYLAMLSTSAGMPRYDLKGEPKGEVTPEQAEHAGIVLAAYMAKTGYGPSGKPSDGPSIRPM